MLSSASEIVVDFKVEPAAVERERMSRTALEGVNSWLYVIRESEPAAISSWDDEDVWLQQLQPKAAHS